MTAKEQAIQAIQELLAYNQATVESLKELANKKGQLYAIMDRRGSIHAIRKTYGSAHRVLRQGQFSFVARYLTNPDHLQQEYQVVTLHLSELVNPDKNLTK